jgi:two-component system, CAI-1 autoinducer sensor kinase/phosphatase CqsS
MSAQALKSGLQQFIGKRRTHRPLRAVVQQLMNVPAGSSRNTAAALAGRRIVLAASLAALSGALQSAGAHVLQLAPGASLPQQLLLAADGADAVLLPLETPGDESLAAARALRACGQPWAATPLLGLAADPDAFAGAAAAAGFDGLLPRPVETILLYQALTRLITAGAGSAQPAQAAPDSELSVLPDPLLNLQRLDSYKRLGMLQELVGDYLPEMERQMATLQEAVTRSDRSASLAALHSLLGMSGEAGAQGLYQHVRELYVPLLEHGHWPVAPDWLAQLAQLAVRTDEALRAYCTAQARSGAA